MGHGNLSERLPERQNSRRRVVVQVFQWVIALLVLATLGWTIWKAALDLSTQPISWQSIQWGFLALGWVGSCLALSCVAALWHGCLHSMGASISWMLTSRAFFASQLAKYVPGKAMVLIVRCGLICSAPTNGKKIKIGPVIASSFVETMVWVLVGAEIGCVGLLFLEGVPSLLRWGALGVLVIFGFVTLPPVFSKIVDAMGRRKRLEDWAVHGFRLTWKSYACACAWSLLGWGLNGLALLCVMIALTGQAASIDLYGLALTTICLSTVGGFISMLPGGLGVRELVMLPLLTLVFTPGIALVIAILMRLVGITAELMLAIGAAVTSRRWGNRPAEQ